jgi:hypothetical protein
MADISTEEKETARAWNQRGTATLSPELLATSQSSREPGAGQGQPGFQDQTRNDMVASRELNMARRRDQSKRQGPGGPVSGGEENEEETSGEETAGTPPQPRGNNLLFGLSLTLALIKDIFDFFDIVDLGLIGIFINFIPTAAFGLILLLQGSSINKKKAVQKKALAAIAEFIPIVSFLPWWTISVIWEKVEQKYIKKDDKSDKTENKDQSATTKKS